MPSRTEEELRHPIDRFSRTLISHYIELLLDYCTRYYERQFITREDKNKALLRHMDRILDNYITSDQLKHRYIATPDYCAEQLEAVCGIFQRPATIRDRKKPARVFPAETPGYRQKDASGKYR